MDDKKIKEILKDPNTWEWDGCTLPENAEKYYSEDFFENLPEHLKPAKSS